MPKYSIGEKVILKAQLTQFERNNSSFKKLARFCDEYDGKEVTISDIYDGMYYLEEAPDMYTFQDDELIPLAFKRFKKLSGLYLNKI